jgi:hypothetical protein
LTLCTFLENEETKNIQHMLGKLSPSRRALVKAFDLKLQPENTVPENLEKFS